MLAVVHAAADEWAAAKRAMVPEAREYCQVVGESASVWLKELERLDIAVTVEVIYLMGSTVAMVMAMDGGAVPDPESGTAMATHLVGEIAQRLIEGKA